MQGAWVRSLVRELRSHMLCSTAPHPPTKTPNIMLYWINWIVEQILVHKLSLVIPILLLYSIFIFTILEGYWEYFPEQRIQIIKGMETRSEEVKWKYNCPVICDSLLKVVTSCPETHLAEFLMPLISSLLSLQIHHRISSKEHYKGESKWANCN